MTENILKKKLEKGGCVFGTWAMLPSAGIVNAIGSASLDFVIIDMEHGSMSFETAEEMVRAAEVSGCQPIIRTSDKSESSILRALETGSRAVMVPHVSTPQEAARVVKAARYAPDGERGLSPYTRAHGYSHENIKEKLAAANKNTLVGILVEGKEGIQNLEAISDIKGIDLIYAGIYDLSQSIGLAGQLNHRKVLDLQKRCVDIIRKKGKAAGSFARDYGYINLLYKNGFQFIAYLVDCAVLTAGYKDSVHFFENIAKRKTKKV